ncbi:hypothetical protein DFH27DRAFT_605952 [Peziza echinospora]|nr:hypothetical protein DFH27DRAFT_605952 [Peziza echinospora]
MRPAAFVIVGDWGVGVRAVNVVERSMEDGRWSGLLFVESLLALELLIASVLLPPATPRLLKSPGSRMQEAGMQKGVDGSVRSPAEANASGRSAALESRPPGLAVEAETLPLELGAAACVSEAAGPWPGLSTAHKRTEHLPFARWNGRLWSHQQHRAEKLRDGRAREVRDVERYVWSHFGANLSQIKLHSAGRKLNIIRLLMSGEFRIRSLLGILAWSFGSSWSRLPNSISLPHTHSLYLSPAHLEGKADPSTRKPPSPTPHARSD